MKEIIQENSINETAAREFLNEVYDGINLLPNVPNRINKQIAAAVLNVSIPTIERMIQDNQLELTKKSVLQYIMDHMLVNRPVSWNDEEKMNAKAKEMSPESLKEHQKAFRDIEESIAGLYKEEEELPGLFSEEDLKQE